MQGPYTGSMAKAELEDRLRAKKKATDYITQVESDYPGEDIQAIKQRIVALQTYKQYLEEEYSLLTVHTYLRDFYETIGQELERARGPLKEGLRKYHTKAEQWLQVLNASAELSMKKLQQLPLTPEESHRLALAKEGEKSLEQYIGLKEAHSTLDKAIYALQGLAEQQHQYSLNKTTRQLSSPRTSTFRKRPHESSGTTPSSSRPHPRSNSQKKR